MLNNSATHFLFKQQSRRQLSLFQQAAAANFHSQSQFQKQVRTNAFLSMSNRRQFSSNVHEGGSQLNHGIINVFGFAVFVREKYACLVHRFQKYDRVLTPGLNFKLPFIDQVEYVHDLREQVIEISS